MASSFKITTTATDTLHPDAQGHAQAEYTVTNTTGHPIRGLAKVKALGDTKLEWLTLSGDAERDFAAGGTQKFTVNFDIKTEQPVATAPVAAGAKPTAAAPAPAPVSVKYPFRLDIASSKSPDEDFSEGPVVTAEKTAAPIKKPSNFPMWIIPGIIVVLIG